MLARMGRVWRGLDTSNPPPRPAHLLAASAGQLALARGTAGGGGRQQVVV